MSEALNREYHELLGWKLDSRPEIDDDYRAVTIYRLVSPDFSFLGEWKAAPPEWVWEKQIPKLHLDANLAIAELDRVLIKPTIPPSYWYSMRTMGLFQISYKVSDKYVGPFEGGTFTEAALKCLIAAHKREAT